MGCGFHLKPSTSPTSLTDLLSFHQWFDLYLVQRPRTLDLSCYEACKMAVLVADPFKDGHHFVTVASCLKKLLVLNASTLESQLHLQPFFLTPYWELHQAFDLCGCRDHVMF